MKILSVLLLLCLNLRLSLQQCGNSTQEECEGVYPCLDMEVFNADGCTACSIDDDCDEEQFCLQNLGTGLCVDTGGVQVCDSSCFSCGVNFDPDGELGVSNACFCDTSANNPCYNGGSCSPQTEDSGYCVEPNPNGGGGGGGPECFSEKSTCIEQAKGQILVKDVQVGDKVLTRSGQFQTVYTVDHHDPQTSSQFLQIVYTTRDRTNNNLHPVLEVTPSHMVFLHGEKDPVASSQLTVGDAIEISIANSSSSRNIGIIQTISKVSRKGVYNIITTDGTIVVNGVVASTYSVPFRHEKQGSYYYLPFAGRNVVSYQTFLHTLMTPFRVLCMLGVNNNNEYPHGLNLYSYMGTILLEFILKRHAMVQDFMLLLAFTACVLFSMLLSLPGAIIMMTTTTTAVVLCYSYLQDKIKQNHQHR